MTSRTNTPSRPILGLQQKIGNRAVGRLLRARGVQAQRNIGRPDDKYEREADRGVRTQDMGLHRQRSGGPSTALPHAERIQASFGRHDLSDVQAQVGGVDAEAAKDLGVKAYATGNRTFFAKSPNLHTAAHEAAHVVQQRGGVSLKDGVSNQGDAYERHANRVADLVVRGESAERELDKMTPPAGGGRAAQSKVLQFDLEDIQGDLSYDDPEIRMPGRRRGQDLSERTTEYTGELITEMVSGAVADVDSGDYERQLSNLQRNADAVYGAVITNYYEYASALFRAHDNMQTVLREASREQQEDAALINGVLSIGLSVLAAGAGVWAEGAFARVLGRFNRLPARVRESPAVLEMTVEFFKQGIQVGGGAVLQVPDMDVPDRAGNISSVEGYATQAPQAIRRERQQVRRAIQWMGNNREQLEGVISPAALLMGWAPQWAQLQAGARAMGAAVDTKVIERELWKPWLEQNSVEVPTLTGRRPTLADLRAVGTREVELPDVVVEHLRRNLNATDAQINQWSGRTRRLRHRREQARRRARYGRYGPPAGR